MCEQKATQGPAEGPPEKNSTATFLGFVTGIGVTLIFAVPINGLKLNSAIKFGDLGTWVQSVGVVVGVIYAARQLREQTRSYADTTRPYVVATFSHVRDAKWIMRIENKGKSAGNSVRFKLMPDFEHSMDDELIKNIGKPFSQWPLFADGLAYLAPGEELTLFFDDFRERKKKSLPFDYDLTITYRDAKGKCYEEARTLDFDALSSIMVPPESELALLQKEMQTVSKSLKAIVSWKTK